MAKYTRGDQNDADCDNVQVNVEADGKATGLTDNANTLNGETDTAEDKRCLPVLFERAAYSWWNPQFDSSVLELQYHDCCFQQTRRRFQYALLYILLSGLAWTTYLVIHLRPWPSLIPAIIVIVITIVLLALSFTRHYRRLILLSSVLLTFTLTACCLLSFAYMKPFVSPVGMFVSSIDIIVLLYTLIPLPLYLCFSLGVLYSVIFEVLSVLYLPDVTTTSQIVARGLLHVGLHLIGLHMFIMTQVRNRSTFLKVGQSIMSRQDLEIEKQLKRKMIHSLMPPKVAEEVMKSRGEDNKDEDATTPGHPDEPRLSGGQLKFRNFHMNKMENVTILFADIVGFTQMSSNKTAVHLVNLLNDLFGRFDKLCAHHGCEKISTLGDCYYCVSGCPEPRPDHARCCVEMGLSMCRAIRQFDEDHNEAVNMRVGVHTGTVLCGLVGTRRFKFDVWSHDVTLANTMESDGRPGLVHVSDNTYQLLQDYYTVEPGESVEDIRNHKRLIEQYNSETQKYVVRHVKDEDIIKTWFITGRIKPATPATGVGSITTDNALGHNGDLDPSPVNDITEDKNSFSMTVMPSTNGLSPTALLNKRDNLTASVEELAGEKAEVSANTALMAQLQTHQQLRHQTDKQLVQSMRAESNTHAYLYCPPINEVTLSFLSPQYEQHYREHASVEPVEGVTRSMALPHYAALSDIIVGCIFLAVVSIGCAMTTRWQVFVAVGIAAILQVALLVAQVVYGGRLLGWNVRHLVGAVAVCLPSVVVLAGYGSGADHLYHVILLTSLLHFANFGLLSSWLKSGLAVAVAIVTLVLVSVHVRDNSNMDTYRNTTSMIAVTSVGDVPMARLRYELIIDVLLLLLLIAFLNREFEVSQRLGFDGDERAAADHARMHVEKGQADWLLHNIIPRHVADILKRTSQYCDNHSDVGVLFAKVINYDDFYDESYKGGREYLRVLNELMGDFEDLFDQERFQDVEKIKTIGACLMAASGLNPEVRRLNRDPNAHLYALIDFAVELLRKLEAFNAEIFNFDFKMAIGFNYGEVTSGVIGTTKLLYDIWGDTVNISSRMYSTGVAGRVQLTEPAAQKLSSMYEFEYRGKTFVKGKGDMNTYLLVKKISSWE